MSKRSACSKATRGVAKGKKPASSSSSNPRCTKFRSQYNNLSVIAKGGPSKRSSNNASLKKNAQSALENQKILDGLQTVSMLESSNSDDLMSVDSQGTKRTTGSFASVWSNCTNLSLKEFFDVWNPKLEPHKDALSVIAGLTQIMSSKAAVQSDIMFATQLFKILETPETAPNVIVGSLIALTFVLRKVSNELIIQRFDSFQNTLEKLLNQYETSKKKSLLKNLIRCFALLTKAHPLGKKVIDRATRKKINIMIRRCKFQNKVSL